MNDEDRAYRQRRLAYLNAKYGPVPDDGPYDEAWFARHRAWRPHPRYHHHVPRAYARQPVRA